MLTLVGYFLKILASELTDLAQQAVSSATGWEAECAEENYLLVMVDLDL